MNTSQEIGKAIRREGMPMGRSKKPCKSPDDVITATEIACRAYCPEQWRLQYGLVLLPENQAELDAGTRHHDRKAVVERVADGSIGIGRATVAAALVLLLLLWLMWR